MSFADQLRREKSRNSLNLIHGHDKGRACWYYLLVDPRKQSTLLRWPKGKRIPLDEFGEVIASGWGDAPPPEKTREIEARFAE